MSINNVRIPEQPELIKQLEALIFHKIRLYYKNFKHIIHKKLNFKFDKINLKIKGL